MITENEISEILTQSLQLQEVIVNGDGSHFEVIAIDERFADLARLQKHQLIFKPLAEYIANNTIHALSIKTFTPSEWQQHCRLNGAK